MAPDIATWMAVIKGPTQLAVVSSRVVLTVITHTAAHVSRGNEHSHVKGAFARMPIAVAPCPAKCLMSAFILTAPTMLSRDTIEKVGSSIAMI